MLVDPDAKVACETCIKTGMVMIFGEITSKAAVDHQKVGPLPPPKVMMFLIGVRLVITCLVRLIFSF